MQKIHKHGTDGNRFFWNVKSDKMDGVYRSRCATAAGVRKQLKSRGHTVTSVRQARA